jgi:hypothetical protein
MRQEQQQRDAVDTALRAEPFGLNQGTDERGRLGSTDRNKSVRILIMRVINVRRFSTGKGASDDHA